MGALALRNITVRRSLMTEIGTILAWNSREAIRLARKKYPKRVTAVKLGKKEYRDGKNLYKVEGRK